MSTASRAEICSLPGPAQEPLPSSEPPPLQQPHCDHGGAPRTGREEVRWVRENSGLSWRQLGLIFGVGARTVHAWANGLRIGPAQARLVRELAHTIRDLDAGTPEQTRAALTSAEPGQASIVDGYRRRHASKPRITGPLSLTEQFRLIDRLEVREPVRLATTSEDAPLCRLIRAARGGVKT